MKIRSTLIALVSIAILVGCATQPATTRNFDESNDFSSYKTYALLPNPVFYSDKELNPAVVETVSESIRKTLANKGFSEVADRASADFTVGFAVGATRYIEIRSLPVDYRSALGGPWGTIYYEDREFEVRKGSLAIHIFDVESRTAVYATAGSKRLKNKDTQEGINEIPNAVEALLADFPPS